MAEAPKRIGYKALNQGGDDRSEGPRHLLNALRVSFAPKFRPFDADGANPESGPCG